MNCKSNMSEQYALELLSHFSVITVGKNKVPNFPWALQQKQKLSTSEFLTRFHHKGGCVNGENLHRPKTEGIGLITGYDNLELLDIDIKVLQGSEEKKSFEKELFKRIICEFSDFFAKVAVYRTVNGGLHFLYKCDTIEKTQAIAKPKGKTTCLFETKSFGGFAMVYPDGQCGGLDYTQIQKISPDERNILMEIAKSYHYEEKNADTTLKHVRKHNYNGRLSVWDDYNEKTDIWGLIQDEFTIVSSNSKFTTIKRLGANSAWSGYIYHDTRMLKLYTTSTRYTNYLKKNGYLSAFDIYTIQNHDGSISKAAAALYNAGFGERI